MSHVATVTIDNTKVVGSLTDYILEIDLSDLPSSFWDVVANGGGDIRVFKDDDTTELAREVVFCDTSNDTGKIFTKITGTLSDSVDTDIHIYADGSASEPAATATYGSQNVWTNYVAVLHFQDNVNDSSPEGNNFTAAGITYGAGKVAGKAVQFGGGTDNINIAHDAAFARDEFTIQAWVNGTSGTGSRVMWKDVSGNNNGDFQITDADNTQFQNGSSQINLSLPFTASTWQLIAFRATAAGANTWKNAAQVATSATAWSFAANALALYLGNRDSLSSGWVGDMAEFRLCKSSLSNDWMETEYNNQNDPATFYSTAAAAGGGGGTDVAIASETVALSEPAMTVDIEVVPGAGLDGYTTHQTVTIDNTQIPSALTNFVMTIDLADLSKAGADIFDTCRSDGGDIRVTLSDDTEIPRVIRAIDTGAKTGFIQVLVPSVSAASDTVLKVWYNGTDTEPAASSTYGENKVFDADYAYASIDGGASDVSGQISAPTAVGGVTAGGATGINGGSATDFDGSDDRIELGNSIIGAGDAYMSVIVQRKTASAFADDMYFLSCADGDGSSNTNQAGLGHLDFPGGTLGAQFLLDRTGNENQYINGETALPSDGSLVKIEIVLDSGGTSRIYVNGAEQATKSLTGDLGDIPTPLAFTLGALRHNGGYNSYADIRIADIRIRQGLRTADYISTEYTSETSPSTLYSTSDEQVAETNVDVASETIALTEPAIFVDLPTSFDIPTETITLSEPAMTVDIEEPIVTAIPSETLALSEPAVTVAFIATHPTNLSVTPIDDNAVTVSWTKGVGNDFSYVIMKEGSAPTDENDGHLVYMGKGTSVRVNHLRPGLSYYFRAYGNSPTYGLGTENTLNLSGTPFGVAVSDQYIFIARYDVLSVEVRRRSDPTTLLATITPGDETPGAQVKCQSIDFKGNRLAFGGKERVYLYEFIDENNYTELLNEDLGGSNDRGIRATHIDEELEYVYYGGSNGVVTWYRLSDLTKYSYTLSSGNDIRKFATSSDSLFVACNDNNVYHIDRSDRTTSATNSVVENYGTTMEVVVTDANYLYTAGDNQEVDIRNLTTPWAVQDTLTNPTNDITAIRPQSEDYLCVSSDDTQIYIYDVNDSYALESTINKAHGVEDSWMDNGDLYYQGGAEGVADTKFYYRDYYTNTLTAGSSELRASTSSLDVAIPSETISMTDQSLVVAIPPVVAIPSETLTFSEPTPTAAAGNPLAIIPSEILTLEVLTVKAFGDVYTNKYPLNPDLLS